jgi:hypothetical protein
LLLRAIDPLMICCIAPASQVDDMGDVNDDVVRVTFNKVGATFGGDRSARYRMEPFA